MLLSRNTSGYFCAGFSIIWVLSNDTRYVLFPTLTFYSWIVFISDFSSLSLSLDFTSIPTLIVCSLRGELNSETCLSECCTVWTPGGDCCYDKAFSRPSTRSFAPLFNFSWRSYRISCLLHCLYRGDICRCFSGGNLLMVWEPADGKDSSRPSPNVLVIASLVLFGEAFMSLPCWSCLALCSLFLCLLSIGSPTLGRALGVSYCLLPEFLESVVTASLVS